MRGMHKLFKALCLLLERGTCLNVIDPTVRGWAEDRAAGGTQVGGGCRPMQYEVQTRRGVRAAAETSFRFGIEEEYFLCDVATLQPAMSTPESLFKRHC